MKKLKKIKNSLIVILIIFIIILFTIVFMLSRKSKNEIVGTWTTDDVTVYKFNKDNTGALMLPLDNYEFTYEIDDHNLTIDFKSEKSKDSKYTYYFKDDKLILEGSNGKFTFKKKTDKSKD